MMACLPFSLLALATYTFHCHAAALNINIPNLPLQDSRKNVKTLRAKRRAIDRCERFIRGYNKRIYDTCIRLGSPDPFCNKAQCPNKPSHPKTINHSFYLNKTTMRLNLNITWEEPEFGLGYLCGFQINVASLSVHLGTVCKQLNSKDLFTFTIPNVGFDAKYKITITSLPAFEESLKSSKYVTLTSPNKCTLLRQLHESLPWFCGIKTNFPVVCESGKIKTALQKLGNVVIDEYISMISKKDSPDIPIKFMLHEKNQSFAIYTGLQLDIQYVLMITFVKGDESHMVSSQPFTCKKPAEESYLLLILLVLLAVCILLTFLICIKCNLVPKIKILCKIRQRQPFSTNAEDIPFPDDSNSRVLLVYPFGCEQLKELLLLLGQLLQNMGCKCILDLVMEETVQEESDREVFIMKKLEEIKEDDRVIFVNYKGTDHHSQNALKLHQGIIFSRIYRQMLNENNFIALYFVKGEKTEFSSNIYFTGNIAKELQRLVRIIWKIPPYQFGKRCPQKNDIELDAYLEKQIILKTNELMASAHYSCSRDTCPKGQKSVHTKTDCSVVLNRNANSTNSFCSTNLPDDDTTDDLYDKKVFSRLSSSEPLLFNGKVI